MPGHQTYGGYLAMSGPFGRARRVMVPAGHRTANYTVACWFLNMPGQGRFGIAVLDLDAMDDDDDAMLVARNYTGARYELTVLMLTGDSASSDLSTWLPQQPAQVAEQFHGVDRVRAARIAEWAARACVHGRLPVLTRPVVVAGHADVDEFDPVSAAVEVWRAAVDDWVDQLRGDEPVDEVVAAWLACSAPDQTTS